jgi:F-type H+-transporting ATPase subunit epsilon
MALQLTVVTPAGRTFDGEVEQVVLPGSEGDFGVLEQHERFLTSLRPGALEIIGSGDASQWAAVSDGFADVGAEQVTVLVSRCDLKADLDPASIAAEISEIEAGLNQLSGSDEDAPQRAELEHQLEIARVRLEVAGL